MPPFEKTSFSLKFFQDVASVRVNGEQGDISVLGHIDHRLVCTPDFEMLLDSTWSLEMFVIKIIPFCLVITVSDCFIQKALGYMVPAQVSFSLTGVGLL